MRETTLPALQRGLATSGRTLSDLEIAFQSQGTTVYRVKG